MKIPKRITTLFFIIAMSFCWIPITSYALGFEISPARYERAVNPGEVINAKLRITNKGSETIMMFSVKDFTFKDESGTPLIIEAGPDISRYSLTNWITPPEETIIKANETKEVSYIIQIPKDAAPGGHYGTMFVQQKVENINDGKVPTITKVGALIILEVKGNIIKKERIESFHAPKLLISDKDIVFVTRIKNLGNVHVAPKGKIFIANEQGNLIKSIGTKSITNKQGVVTEMRQVDYLLFNPESLIVLPEQRRKYSTKLNINQLKEGNYSARIEIEDALGKMLYKAGPIIFNRIDGDSDTFEEEIRVSAQVKEVEEFKEVASQEIQKKIDYSLYYIIGGIILAVIAIGTIVLKKN